MKELSRSRKGFVLVSVLILGVLLISTATAFSWFARTQAKTLGSEISSLTNRTFAHVLVNSVIGAVSQVNSKTNYDSPTQKWYQPFVIAVPDMGVWVAKVTPLDDKIPLRNLFLPDGTTIRGEITEAWHSMWDKLRRRELEQLVLDFTDRNKKPRVGSTERDYFINRPPFDISELLILSSDIDTDLLYGSGGELGISDYCTIYSDGKININVAPLHVIELLPGLDMGGTAQSIAEYRKDKPIKDLQDLQSIPGAGARASNQLMNIVGFKSRYFNVQLECLTEESEGGASFSIVFDRTLMQVVRWEEL